MAKISRMVSNIAVAASIAAIIFAASCGKMGGGGGVDVDDGESPSQVLDLTIMAVTPTSVTLSWTAPGDDSTTGRAAAYDLRYWNREISWENADSAWPVTGVRAPGPAGTTDTITITGLTEDSTYYFSIRTRDEAENWSWLSNIATAVCFNDFTVTFPDPRLNAKIRTMIGIPSDPIHRTDLLGVEFIDANGDSIADLTGLQYCLNLTGLLLYENHVVSLTPLAGLTKMVGLGLGRNQISDISPLAALVNVEQIDLQYNSITDIAGLSGMAKLTNLTLTGNSVADISALAGKPALQNLDMKENAIVDIGPLSGSTNLVTLNLSRNQITTVTALTGMTALSSLDLYENDVVDITPLAGLTNLQMLNLWGNNITSVAPLADLTKLKNLYLVNNYGLHSIDDLSGLTAMERLYIGNDSIADIGVVANMPALIELNAQGCQVVDLTPLSSLVNIQKIVLYVNHITDISPLVDCPGMGTGDEVYLTYNPLSDHSVNDLIPILRGKGVTVYW